MSRREHWVRHNIADNQFTDTTTTVTIVVWADDGGPISVDRNDVERLLREAGYERAEVRS